MDFIERIYGISPDGGSGSFELLLFLVPLFGLSLFFIAQTLKGSSTRRPRPLGPGHRLR